MSETEVVHVRATYNDIHKLIRNATPKIAEAFKPELLVAIGTSRSSIGFSVTYSINQPDLGGGSVNSLNNMEANVNLNTFKEDFFPPA